MTYIEKKIKSNQIKRKKIIKILSNRREKIITMKKIIKISIRNHLFLKRIWNNTDTINTVHSAKMKLETYENHRKLYMCLFTEKIATGR